jgi:hypothetical protein
MKFMNVVSLSCPHQFGGNFEMELDTLSECKVLSLNVSQWIVLAYKNLLELHHLLAVELAQHCLDVSFLTKLKSTVALTFTRVYKFSALIARSTIAVWMRGNCMFLVAVVF